MSAEDVEEEANADAAVEKRKPAEQSLADALKDDMQADEEKQKLTSEKLKGKPRGPSALSFILANSDRYNYLPLPTPGPQPVIRAPSTRSSATGAATGVAPPNASHAADPRKAEIEAIHDILKARSTGEEAIKVARNGRASVPKVAGPPVVGSPKLKNGIPVADPHQQEIDAIMAARQQATDGCLQPHACNRMPATMCTRNCCRPRASSLPPHRIHHIHHTHPIYRMHPSCRPSMASTQRARSTRSATTRAPRGCLRRP